MRKSDEGTAYNGANCLPLNVVSLVAVMAIHLDRFRGLKSGRRQVVFSHAMGADELYSATVRPLRRQLCYAHQPRILPTHSPTQTRCYRLQCPVLAAAGNASAMLLLLLLLLRVTCVYG